MKLGLEGRVGVGHRQQGGQVEGAPLIEGPRGGRCSSGTPASSWDLERERRQER